MTIHARRILWALATTVVAVAGLVAVCEVFLTWQVGQRVDETALRGSRIGRGQLIDGALSVLGVISVAGLVVMTGAAVVIGISRRRLDLALAAVVVVGGANLSTQVLKRAVLERPDVGIDTSTSNSLPSGHTTVALSVSAALVLVVPARLRPVTALLGAATSILTGVATMAAGWHRPSDVVAATCVVGAWVGLVVLALAVLRPRGTGERVPRSGVLVALALTSSAVVALAVAGLALWRLAQLDVVATARGDLLVAYGGGAAGVAGCVALLLAATLALADGVDPRAVATTTDARVVREPERGSGELSPWSAAPRR